MPWTVKHPPKVAKNWTEAEKRNCVQAANHVLAETGDEAKAIQACIHAAGRSKQHALTLARTRRPLTLPPVPFTEAIQASRRRQVVLPDRYYGELQGLARTLAFTVARLATVDQIQRVLDALDEALKEGGTFADFKRTVEADPDVLTLPRGRVEVIFRNGVQTAYARGRCEQHYRARAFRPYLEYAAINDSRVRPAHLAMNGVILPADHPWWSTHMPPNGHQCRCTVLSLTAAEAEQRGVTVDPPVAKPDPDWDYSPCEQPAAGVRRALVTKRAWTAPQLTPLLPPDVPPVLTLDEMIQRGRDRRQAVALRVGKLAEGLEGITPSQQHALFKQAINAELQAADRPTQTAAQVAMTRSDQRGAALVQQASQVYPDRWTRYTDRLGPLYARYDPGRAWQYSVPATVTEPQLTLKPPFGVITAEPGAGYIVADNLHTAIHEYAHRLQAALPELDDYFQQLHVRRTAGEQRQPLKALTKNPGFYDNEVAKPDNYINNYMGKEYDPHPLLYTGRAGALEMLPMAYESVLGEDPALFSQLFRRDPEFLELSLGLLFEYDP